MSARPSTAIGMDIGSRLTKVVRVAEGVVSDFRVFDTGHDPLRRPEEAIGELRADAMAATGYGRHLAQKRFGCGAVTEIRACARAARALCPDCESAVDIGGQDSKALELRAGGGFGRFEMNDRCAAGTGRFLEVMARALGYALHEMGREALQADGPAAITSLCTVFAESEVVSLVARGEDRRRIARGLYHAAAARVAAMASRIRLGRKALFVGGVANDPCMVAALREHLGCDLFVPDRPELANAFGAALLALDGG